MCINFYNLLIRQLILNNKKRNMLLLKHSNFLCWKNILNITSLFLVKFDMYNNIKITILLQWRFKILLSKILNKRIGLTFSSFVFLWIFYSLDKTVIDNLYLSDLLQYQRKIYFFISTLDTSSKLFVTMQRLYRDIYAISIPYYSIQFQVALVNTIKQFKNNSILLYDSSWNDKDILFTPYLFKIINKLIKKGKKQIAIKHFLNFLFLHKLNNLKLQSNYLLSDIIASISPKFKLITIKFRGRNMLVPKLVTFNKVLYLGISLFLQALRSRSERNIVMKMFNEVLDIYKLRGQTLKLKEINYKQALSNKSLLFRRSVNWRKRKLYTLNKNKYYLG